MKKNTLPAACTLKVVNALDALEFPSMGLHHMAKDAVKAHIFRAEREGLQKYGHTMDRDDLTRAEWMRHLFEELCNRAQYAQRSGLVVFRDECLRMAARTHSFIMEIKANDKAQ